MKMLKVLPGLLAALFLTAQPCSLGWLCEPACPMPDCSGPTTQWSADTACCCEADAPADREGPGSRAGTLSKGQPDGLPIVRVADDMTGPREAGLAARHEAQRPAASLLIQNAPLLI
ncbi:MAG: hypothetical protein ACREAA_11170 [Candidatus Polarisedimenticolia bacterium]